MNATDYVKLEVKENNMWTSEGWRCDKCGRLSKTTSAVCIVCGKPKENNMINRMGCSENWYNPHYAIRNTFSKEELENMTESELNNLVKLAKNISEALY